MGTQNLTTDQKFTTEYLSREYIAFRKIMCSTLYTLEQKLKAFAGLILVYLNTETKSPEEENRIQVVMNSLKNEFDTRTRYQLSMEIAGIFDNQSAIA